MILLVLGLLLWASAHVFKRALPEQRAHLAQSLGEGPAKAAFALPIAAGLLLMILGYRSAPYVAVWTPPAAMVHLNNTLMLIAVYLFGASHSKTWIKTRLRNPMLTAVVVWAVAHLLVNGDLASILLFGGLGLWALLDIRLIDAASPWQRPVAGPRAAELRLVLITLVAFAGITAIHAWLGVWPFPG